MPLLSIYYTILKQALLVDIFKQLGPKVGLN